MTQPVVPLAFSRPGEASPVAPPWVVLHGLMGRGRNWLHAAKALAARTEAPVWTLDLRNHGDSPHAAPMDYPSMAADVRAWLDAQLPDQPVRLIGHSMGGKVAMRLAVDRPDLVAQLVVIDITAGPVEPRWGPEFAAMAALDLAGLPSRQAADAALVEAIPHPSLRQFLLSNLERDRAAGGWRWKVNLPLIRASMDALFAAPLAEGEQFRGPTQWIRGGRSNFFAESEWPIVQAHFPTAQLFRVPDAGHNVHTDNLPGLLEVLAGA